MLFVIAQQKQKFVMPRILYRLLLVWLLTCLLCHSLLSDCAVLLNLGMQRHLHCQKLYVMLFV